MSEANEQWVETSQDSSTFEKGGSAAKLSGKTVTITAAKAETRPYGGKNEETKDTLGTFVDVTFHPDGEKEAVTEQYRAGDPSQVKANAAGDALLTRKGTMSDSTQYAKLIASVEAAGYKLQTTKVTELVGLRFEVIAVAEKYDFKDKATGRQVKGEKVSLHAKKFVGRLDGPLPVSQGSGATAVPLQVAAAGSNLAETIANEAIAAVMAADGGKITVKDLRQAILKAVPADQKVAASRTMIAKDFFGGIPGLQEADGIVTAA